MAWPVMSNATLSARDHGHVSVSRKCWHALQINIYIDISVFTAEEHHLDQCYAYIWQIWQVLRSCKNVMGSAH